MIYTIIFKYKKCNTDSVAVHGILNVFYQIRKHIPTIKSKKLNITLTKDDDHISEYLFQPKDTNVLIRIVNDFSKFVENKLLMLEYPKKGEVLVFNTGDSEWIDTDILEALKRPCDKTTKVMIVKKKDLIEVSNEYTNRGIFKLKNKVK